MSMKTIGITWGDQAGIGPEVVEAALAALAAGPLAEGYKFQMIGKKISAVPGTPTTETARAALDGLEE